MLRSAISTATAITKSCFIKQVEGRDNSQAGMTDPPILQAYKLDGTLMWTINLGKNIREGAHYTQFMVYDLDGDGRAEIACKTADGTTDGKGKVIGDAKADWRNPEGSTAAGINSRGEQGSRNTTGYMLKGPEYLTRLRRTDRSRARDDKVSSRPPSRHRQSDDGANAGRLGRRLRQPHRPLPRRRRVSRRNATEPHLLARLLHTKRDRCVGFSRRKA